MDPQLWEEIESGNASEEIDAIVRLRDGMDPPAKLTIIARFGSVATCRLRRADIIVVRAHPSVVSLEASRRLIGDTPAESIDISERQGSIEFVSRRPRITETGAGVVLGAIDYGCDFAHQAFRNSDGTTRIKYLWDQRSHRDTSRASTL